MDASIFAAQFSEMFKDFVKQQQRFQTSLEKSLKNIDKTLANKILPKKKEYDNENQKKYLEGRPDNIQTPRKVVQDSVKVIIEDISKKAADKLRGDQTSVTNIQTQQPKGGLSLIEKILGGLSLGFLARELGIDTSALSTGLGVAGGIGAAGGIFKKLLKRLPGVPGGPDGKFKKLPKRSPGVPGVPDGKFKKLPKRSPGVPGVPGGPDGKFKKLPKRLPSVPGGIFKKFLKRLPLVGLLISTGEAISKFIKGGPKNIISGLLDIASGISYMFPGLGTAIGLGIDGLNYFFEKTIDKAEGEGKSVGTFGDIGGFLTDWMSTWVSDNIVTPIINFFDYVGEQISNAIKAVKQFARNLVNKAKEIIDEYSPTTIAENLTGVTEQEAIAQGQMSTQDMLMKRYKQLRDRAKKLDITDQEIRNQMIGIGVDEAGLNERNTKLQELINNKKQQPPPIIDGSELQQWEDNQHQGWIPVDQTEHNKNVRFETKDPVNDFTIFNSKLNGIVMGNKFQEFNKDDSIIGFKSGEALVKSLETLISVGKEQLQLLQMYLDANKQAIIAPSTNNTNNYTFNVESSVSAFRKSVS